MGSCENRQHTSSVTFSGLCMHGAACQEQCTWFSRTEFAEARLLRVVGEASSSHLQSKRNTMCCRATWQQAKQGPCCCCQHFWSCCCCCCQATWPCSIAVVVSYSSLVVHFQGDYMLKEPNNIMLQDDNPSARAGPQNGYPKPIESCLRGARPIYRLPTKRLQDYNAALGLRIERHL
jgi:hypothetical protein